MNSPLYIRRRRRLLWNYVDTISNMPSIVINPHGNMSGKKGIQFGGLKGLDSIP